MWRFIKTIFIGTLKEDVKVGKRTSDIQDIILAVPNDGLALLQNGDFILLQNGDFISL